MEKDLKLTILVKVTRKFAARIALKAPIWLGVSLGPLLGVCACTGGPRGAPDIKDPDPANKIRGDKLAVQNKDMSAVTQLVKDLESDDPAIRFYAISTLQRLTGQAFGYQYFAGDEQRATAVEQWKAWLAGWQAGQRRQQQGSPQESHDRK